MKKRRPYGKGNSFLLFTCTGVGFLELAHGPGAISRSQLSRLALGLMYHTLVLASFTEKGQSCLSEHWIIETLRSLKLSLLRKTKQCITTENYFVTLEGIC